MVLVAAAATAFGLLFVSRADGFTLQYRVAGAGLPNDESSHEAAPLCPSKTKVLGGGILTSGGPPAEDVEVSSTLPDDLVPEPGSQPDDGWLGSAVNSSDEPVGAIVVDAICGRGWNPRYRSASIPLRTRPWWEKACAVRPAPM